MRAWTEGLDVSMDVGMDRLGGLSGAPRHRIPTGRIPARAGRLDTPDKSLGDLFSS